MAVKKPAPKKASAPEKPEAKPAAPKAAAAKAVPAKAKAAPAPAAAEKKPAASKAAPVKKEAPVKAAAPAKSAPAPKAVAPAKKAAPEVKPAAPAKAVAPAKKAPAAPAKKAAPVKPEPVAAPKKAAPAAKPAPEVKPAPAPAKPAAAEVKPAAPKPAAKPERKQTSKEKAAANAAAIKKIMASQNPAPVPKPAPMPASRIEKKPNVVVAHRRMEQKSRDESEAGKTMINYQPDFTRSILDTDPQPMGPVYRYSDEELEEFRELINQRLDAARKELVYLQGLITRKDEAGTEDTENRYMNMEDGSGAMEREQLAQLASRQIQFMGHLEKALMRIENKTYGICRVTGKLIDRARLRAVPHATLSIEAKKMISK